MLHIPGDNDIGGESSKDIVTDEKVVRFGAAFHEQGYLDVRNRTRLFNVNLLTSVYPNVTRDSTPTHMTRVIVTHMSLLSYPGLYTDKVRIQIMIIAQELFGLLYFLGDKLHSATCCVLGTYACIPNYHISTDAFRTFCDCISAYLRNGRRRRRGRCEETAIAPTAWNDESGRKLFGNWCANVQLSNGSKRNRLWNGGDW